jgi:hypothetical protein
MFTIIGLIATAALAAFGYFQTRAFVSRRLAYVDAVHRSGAPLIAGIGAAVLAMPVVALLPLVGGGTALLFGASVGLGVSAGTKATERRRLGA